MTELGGVTELVLDGASMHSLADLHAQVAQHPDTPDWYGPSLDGLFDVLVAIYPAPLRVRWNSAEAARAAMGDDFRRARIVFEDAVAYRRERGEEARFEILHEPAAA